MNDWLDYKGSGSARAYAANGLMSDSNISHGLFGIQTKKDKEDMKARQREADKRYNKATVEKYNKLQAAADKAKKEYEDSIDQYNYWVKEYSNKSTELRNLEADRKRVSAKSPLTAAQMYEPRIKRATDDKNHAAECVQTWRDEMSKLKEAWRKASGECVKYWSKEINDRTDGRINPELTNAVINHYNR